LKTWHRLHNLRYNTPTALQAAFTAGTTFLLSAVQTRAPKRRVSAIQGVKDCLMLLDHMGHSWTAAAQKAEILAGLASDYGVRLEGVETGRDEMFSQPMASGQGVENQGTGTNSLAQFEVPSGSSKALGKASDATSRHRMPAASSDNLVAIDSTSSGQVNHLGIWDPISIHNPTQTLDFDMNTVDFFNLPEGFDLMEDPETGMLHMLLDRISAPHAQAFPFQPGLFAPGPRVSSFDPSQGEQVNNDAHGYTSQH
jgi:hypothetical protein